MRVLVLGGTAEARDLAALLVADGHAVVSSLAGRVARPRLPVGEVRIGGFGGVAGLRAYAEGFDAVVDATHPFAARISRNAAEACPRLVRLERPGWTQPVGADWRWVSSSADAASVTAALGHRPFLTVGRQELAAYVEPLRDHAVLARVVDPPEVDLPPTWEVLLDRGPYDLASETALLRDRDVLVTKDSGGSHTWPKLEAACDLGVPAVVVRRLARPDVPSVASPAEVARWLGTR